MNKHRRVETTSIAHYNQFSNPNEEVAFAENNDCKRINSLTLYNPKKIKIDEFLEENPPNFNYHRDHFVYIIHLIATLPSRKRDNIDKYNGYTILNSQLLQKRNHNYKTYIEYLKTNNIIECDNSYIKKKKSLGYKISDSYISNIIPIRITKWTLIKSILWNKDYNKSKTNDLGFLKKWFNPKLTVDLNSGYEYLNEEFKKEKENGNINKSALRFNARLLPFLKLSKNQYDFQVDNSGFRLHTNITQLKTELRKHLSYDGQKLVAIDIKNSQPFLSRALFNKGLLSRNNIHNKIINPNVNTNYNMLVDLADIIENKPDSLEYKELVDSGEFYEKFGDTLIENNIISETDNNVRDEAKKITFSTLFSPNNSIAYNSAMKVFKEKFPNIYILFKLIKKGRNRHNRLAILLQRLEAELVLDRACKIINRLNPNIPIFTLHDSIITTEKNVDFVEMILSKILEKYVGIKPSLKTEKWV